MRSLIMAVLIAGAAACASSNGAQPDALGGGPDAMLADAAVTIDAGVPDATVEKPGRRGNGIVAGGVRSSSTNFLFVGSMTAGDGTSESTSFKHRGGVIGVTQ